MRKKLLNTLLTILMVMIIFVTPVSASSGDTIIQPRFNNISGASITIGFDMNNIVYITVVVDTYAHGSGASGIVKLFDSDGNCLDVWSFSDYEKPIGMEFTYQGEYGETYTATFEGYAYSNNQTAPDRLEMSVTGTCRD